MRVISLIAMSAILTPSMSYAQTQPARTYSAQELTELNERVERAGVAVPRGAVMAFNLKTCPKGWHPFGVAAGRVVVGTGAGAGLTVRSLGDSGGEEQHMLTVEEMPSHSHGGNVSLGGHSYEHHQYGNGRLPGESWQSGTMATGGNRPHNNMQPYIALLYCEKE